MAGPNVLLFNDMNFETEVLKAEQPTLVDFTATWCAPCRAISPIVDQLAEQFAGRVRIGKLDIDESPATPQKYMIRGVPTLLVFKGGKVVDQVVGLTQKSKLEAILEKTL